MVHKNDNLLYSHMATNGYDLPLLGIDNGQQFIALHSVALICIFFSIIGLIFVNIKSFRDHKSIKFSKWQRSERLVIYTGICDFGFNSTHSLDHLQILITRNHVYPKELCKIYAFVFLVFGLAQAFLAVTVAINAFILIYFRKKWKFGEYDWKLLLTIFGCPTVIATTTAAAGLLGPTGAFCFFDGVKASVSNIFLTTIPMCLILVVNTILYALTWYRINTEAKRMKNTLGNTSTTIQASHRVARNMFLFLTAFFIQWWAIAVYGIWLLFSEAPFALLQVVTIFSNIGGVLNGIVYAIIRRRRRATESDDTRGGKTQVSVIPPSNTEMQNT